MLRKNIQAPEWVELIYFAPELLSRNCFFQENEAPEFLSVVNPDILRSKLKEALTFAKRSCFYVLRF